MTPKQRGARQVTDAAQHNAAQHSKAPPCKLTHGWPGLFKGREARQAKALMFCAVVQMLKNTGLTF